MKRILLFLTVCTLALPISAQEDSPGTVSGAAVDTTGKGYSAALVIETSTRRVLFEENANTPLPTASMAKMMTALITMEEIRDGRLALDSPVTISARTARMGGSQIYAKQGQTFPVRTLLAALMIQSANDAAEALAEKIAGSAENFADLMNSRGKALGLNHSTFYDPHGLPNSQDAKRIDTMSAHDLAMLGMEIMRYPLIREYAKTPTMPFANGTFTSGLTNPNHLINPGKRDYFDAATGIKTGFSAPAGYCVTASARRGDMEVVCVIMGAKAAAGPESAFGLASRFMNQAFDNWTVLPALHKGGVVGQKAVTDGREATVAAVASSNASALVPRGHQGEVKVVLQSSAIDAPVRRGEPVGMALVQQNGQTIARVPVIAGSSVERSPWWKRIWPF
jgi:D-alanyl-D-alanine carboxypeptidase (penicillin-binding protein 5/6)